MIIDDLWTAEEAPDHPQKGETHMQIAVETIRSVARRAVEDPTPGEGRPPAGVALPGSTPRIAHFVKGMFTGDNAGPTIVFVTKALAVLSPILDHGRRSAAPSEPEPAVKDQARIDLLRQERAARARQRQAATAMPATARVRPDRPPASSARGACVLVPNDDLLHEVLDLISEALELFIRYRDIAGVRGCLELLDMLSGSFRLGRSEAA